MDALALFSQRVVRDWFARKFEAPTDIQSQAWPVIARGEHVLLTAPTGSGKTLTAFLWAIDRLASGAWEPGGVRVVYVSPLKALNNDIRRNLLGPLDEMGLAIRVKTRSGDTAQHERRAMLRHPPEILVTTPESLNLLLNAHGGRAILGGVETVILDEIHAVAGNKRGAYLMSAVERLVDLSGEFQRLSLSATVRPLDAVAKLVGGIAAAGWRSRPSTARAPPPAPTPTPWSRSASCATGGRLAWSGCFDPGSRPTRARHRSLSVPRPCSGPAGGS